MFTIGKLSKETSVKIPTIRYYESIGLLRTPPRSPGNQRRYSNNDLETLNFIRHSRDLGFSIESVRDLLQLSKHPNEHCGNADAIAQSQLLTVQLRIKKLQRLEKELTRMTQGCETNDSEHCQVLRALSDHQHCLSEH